MAYIQPYFRPNDDPSAPLFAQVWNGFLAERISTNFRLLEAELKAMGQDELSAQEKLIRESITELQVAAQNTKDKELEARTEITKAYIQSESAIAQKQIEYQRAMMEEEGRRMTAAAELEAKPRDYGPKINEMISQRDNFGQYFANNPQAIKPLVDAFNAESGQNAMRFKMSSMQGLAGDHKWMSNFGQHFMDKYTETALGMKWSGITNQSLRRMLMAQVASLAEDKARTTIGGMTGLTDAQTGAKVTKESTMKGAYLKNMQTLFRLAGLGKYNTSTSGSARKFNSKQAGLHAVLIQPTDGAAIAKYAASMRGSVPNEVRAQRIKDKLWYLRQHTLQITGNPSAADREKLKRGLAPHVEFEGKNWGLKELEAELKRNNRLMKMPGGPSRKEREYQTIIADLDPQYAAVLFGWDEKSDNNTTRRRLEIQSSIGRLKDDLAKLQVMKSFKRKRMAEGVGFPAFRKYKSNYLLENPFKVNPDRKLVRDIKTEYKKLRMAPQFGEEESVKYPGLKRGIDYPLKPQQGMFIGLTKDDLPYMRDKETGGITILDPMDANYDNLDRYLRTRMARIITEAEK